MRLSLAVLLALPLWGQAPAIRTGGVVNAASRIPSTLPGSAIARGALFDIFGVRLGASPQSSVVTLTARGVSAKAALLAVSPQHIQGRMPVNAPLGEVSLTVSVNGAASAPVPLRLVRSGFGIYSRNQEGWGPGNIDNLATDGTRTKNGMRNSASPGQGIVVSGTGWGEGGAQIYIAGRPAKVESVRRGAAAGSTDELVVRLPAGTPEGCYVPLQVRQPDGSSGNTVTLAVRAGGGACPPPSIFPIAAWAGGTRALVAVSRTVRESENSTLDEGMAVFASSDQGDAPPSQALLLPPLGACTAYATPVATNQPAGSPVDALMPATHFVGRDAGTMITAARGNVRLPISALPAVGAYRRALGEQRNGRAGRLGPLFLEPGQVLVGGKGGADVGPFSVILPSPEPFVWQNRDSLTIADRRAGIPLRWQPPAQEGIMLIGLNAVDSALSAWGSTYCSAAASAGTFTIPAAMIANLPPTDLSSNAPQASLVISYLPQRNEVPLQATGVDHGIAISIYSQVVQLKLK